MGNPTIFYYPSDASSNLKTIDFGEPLSDMQEQVERAAVDGVSLFGGLTRTVLTARRRVRLVNSNFVDEDLKRKLQNLEAHLQRGRTISFALDSAKAWAGVVNSTGGLQGKTRLRTDGNAFTSYGAGAMVAGDEVCLQSANPEYSYEFIVLDNNVDAADTLVDLDSLVTYDHDETPRWVRHRDFFPALRLPEDMLRQPIVKHTHRIAWTFDVELVEHHAVLTALAFQKAKLGTTVSKYGQVSLDGAADKSGTGSTSKTQSF